jgi:hypothetical protein
MISTLLALSFEIAQFMLAIVCVFEGTRRLSSFGVSKGAVLTATVGFLCCLSYAGISYRAHKYQGDALVLLQRGVEIPELPIDWGANLPALQRESTSHELAEAAFSEHGQLRYHFDETGKRILFSPTQANLDHREEKIAELTKLDAAAEASANGFLRWLLVAFFAATLGIGYARGKAIL